MYLYRLATWACVSCFLLLATSASSRPSRMLLSEPQTEFDRIGQGRASQPSKALQDTVWIADWSFDTAAPCDDSGWETEDNHVFVSTEIYWQIEPTYAGVGGMQNQGATVRYTGSTCCFNPEGYDNGWYQAIRILYSGTGSLSLSYLVDSETGYDFFRVEADSACASFSRVDHDAAPGQGAAAYRQLLFSDTGYNDNGQIDAIALPDFGTTEIHCLYICFLSDVVWSPCDGDWPTTLGTGLAVDNIVVTDASGTRSEDFEDGTLDLGEFVSLRMDSIPFGNWARTFSHVTDNDICTENSTCSWLWTDDTTPTLFNDPSMAFGPGGYVIKNWLDNEIISPWVSLASTPTSKSTIIQFRRFPGNHFSQSRIVQNWSVRSKTQGSGCEFVSPWGHSFSWNSLGAFRWVTLQWDMTPHFDPAAEEIQILHRVTDWQFVSPTPPSPFVPGPGPYIDRTRIGRQVLQGPIITPGIDARTLAQDAFPTEIHPAFDPSMGEHHRPTTDRFGTAAFSMGMDLGINPVLSPNLITGDSIVVRVLDGRGAGGITAVEWSGCIVAGPHTGKAPPPWSVGSNGFFSFPADSVRSAEGVAFPEYWFVDLDDDYFRGGDVMHYFWFAQDAQGGFTSLPSGMSAPPVSHEEAEVTTGGIYEVSFLPTINWDPAYLARIQADSHGKLEPTASELAGSHQKNGILYYTMGPAPGTSPLSGDANRTSFMYTLDRLGYRGSYDTYHHTGMGNTNNHLGGRATVQQAQGYNLIIYDMALRSGGMLPDGTDFDAAKVDQAGWFRSWLAQASLSEAGFATLWILGTNALEQAHTNPLYSTDFGVILNRTDQGLSLNPEVVGQAPFAFAQANMGQAMASFAGDSYVLHGGCPSIRGYDGMSAVSTAVGTHSYRSPSTGQVGDAAIVMNSNLSEAWNTILQAHPWFDISDDGSVPGSPQPEETLLQKVLMSVLPPQHQQPLDPTGTEPSVGSLPLRTVLHPNVPNPFNPLTKFSFDLAREGRVRLLIHDVAGREVRSLVDRTMQPGTHQTVWDGRNDQGQRVASGIYFCRLATPDADLVRKVVLMK